MDTGLQAHAQKLDYLARRLISPSQQIEHKTIQIRQLKHRMDIALQRHLQTNQQTILRLKNSLAQLNPLNVLGRGYAMVQDESQKLITNSNQTKAGNLVNIMFAHGAANATIINVKPD